MGLSKFAKRIRMPYYAIFGHSEYETELHENLDYLIHELSFTNFRPERWTSAQYKDTDRHRIYHGSSYYLFFGDADVGMMFKLKMSNLKIQKSL